MAELRDAENPTRLALEQLVGTYFLPPEARKQMVRAGLNKIFLDNVDSEEINNQKLALDAAKQISSDPEVGLQQETGGGVFINISELQGVFAQLRTMKSPEVLDGRPTDDRIEEGEFEDLPDGGDKSESVPNVPRGFSTGVAAEELPSDGKSDVRVDGPASPADEDKPVGGDSVGGE